VSRRDEATGAAEVAPPAAPDLAAADRRRHLRSRVFWFLAGGGISYLLIAMPFAFLEARTALPVWALSACSIGVSTSFFFLWNFFVNFRTDARTRDALPRYLAAVGLVWLLSSTTLTVLKHVDAELGVHLGTLPLDLDILGTQVILSGLKFVLYHKWVFPVPR
jgi:putative flippase GtrA